VLAAGGGELRVWNEQHLAAAIYVVNLEQRGGCARLTRSNVDRAAVVVARARMRAVRVLDTSETLYVGTAWFLDGPEGGDYAGWGVAAAFQCDPGEWPARYSWSSRTGRLLGRFNGEDTYARYIVLNAEEEPCAKRRRMLEGVWEGLGT
jgi:hypothetical protein